MFGPTPALIQANAKVPLLGARLGPLHTKNKTPASAEIIPNDISVSKSDSWILGPWY